MDHTPPPSLALERAHLDLINRRLPFFALGWLAVAFFWIATLLLETGAASLPSLLLLGFQAGAFATTVVVIRREVHEHRAIVFLVVAMVALGLSWTAFFVTLGGPAAAVAMIQVAFCASAGFTFALRWHTTLVAVLGTLWVSMLADPWLTQAMPPLESATAAAIGTALILLATESAHRSFRRDVDRRTLDEEARQALEVSRNAHRDGEFTFRSLAESMEVAVFIVEGTSLRYVNATAMAMTGYSLDELVNMPFWEVMHPDDREQVQTRGLARQQGAELPAHVEYRIRTKSGTTRWVDYRAVIMEFQGRPAMLGTAIDISARKDAEIKLRSSVAELSRSEEKLRQLAISQVAIREEERKRLGLDLHDDVCQELVGVGILLEAVRQRLPPDAAGIGELERSTQYLNEVVEHLRALASDLRPLQLRDLGLLGSLRALADGMSSDRMRVSVSCPAPMPRLEEDIELAVYRVAQEATLNAFRHGSARAVGLMLSAVDGHVNLEVSDDGSGFDTTSTDGRGLGLVSMEERALALGGRLGIWSERGKGATLLFECPLRTRTGSRNHS